MNSPPPFSLPHECASPDKKSEAPFLKPIVSRDTSVQSQEAECIAIVDGCSLMDDCKTPEGRGVSSSFEDRFLARSRNDPPLLKPRRSSLLHQEYRSWNIPMEEEEVPSFSNSVRNAPLFPDSLSQTHSEETTTTTTHTPLWFPDARDSATPRSTLSLPRRVFLSFQDCHMVRLPPRLSRSDGFLQDISWRLQQQADTTPCRKKSRNSPEPDDLPLLTPVEGYTVPNAPYAGFVSQPPHPEDASPPDLRRYKTDILYTGGISSSYWDSDSAGSSRVATPLPVLDMDDDDDEDASETSSNEDSNGGGMEGGRRSGNDGTSLARLLPVKPPKLKMRTNHPVLLQSFNFASNAPLSLPDDHDDDTRRSR